MDHPTSSTPLLPQNAFIHPPPGDSSFSRSPCPGLNALANHGIIPRDGRRISILQFVRAMRDVYNFSWVLAFVLALVGVLACGNGWSVNLHDLARHNIIEHDDSIAHDNSTLDAFYAPVQPDRSLIDQFLQLSPRPYLTLHDFVTARARRDTASSQPLSKVHARVAYGEAVLAFLVLSVQDKPKPGDVGERMVPKSFLEEWFWEEKFPHGWARPYRTIGFWQVYRESNKFRDMVITMRGLDG
ncbi:Cloroperoxidase [Obba rivulosa]|uniref:Cloroperoxidase n=1 Tax=Obba rivulosa TaxID=1052685 RepID=A0A8E2AZJ6_9APHY|nr:Cloroperoxidase [Obba rivulosa]